MAELDINKIIANISYQVNNDMEDFIVRSVNDYNMDSSIVVNAKKITEALEKQIPKKPTYIGKRFRNHGKHLSNGQSIDSCYECPNCKSHIFHIFDDENYCEYCGQKLDW